MTVTHSLCRYSANIGMQPFFSRFMWAYVHIEKTKREKGVNGVSIKTLHKGSNPEQSLETKRRGDEAIMSVGWNVYLLWKRRLYKSLAQLLDTGRGTDTSIIAIVIFLDGEVVREEVWASKACIDTMSSRPRQMIPQPIAKNYNTPSSTHRVYSGQCRMNCFAWSTPVLMHINND